MKNKLNTLYIVSLLSSVATYGHCSDITMTNAQTGYTGLLRVPSASVVDYGDINFSYARENDINKSTNYGVGAHNTALLNIGLVSGFEISVQSTHKRINGSEPGYRKGGSSDLSFSAKISSQPFFPQSKLSVALGLQDFTRRDNATYHQNQYIVGNWDVTNRLTLVGGYGKGHKTNQMGSDFLDGVFGGVTFQALPHLNVLADFDGTGFNAGVLSTYQPHFFPKGWEAQAKLQLYSNSDTKNRDNAYALLGLKIPLSRYKNKQTVDLSKTQKILEPTASARRIHMSSSRPSDQRYQAVNRSKGSHVLTPKEAHAIAYKLNHMGFENVRIGLKDGKAVITFENNVYLHGQLDAFSAAVKGLLPSNLQQATLILLKNKLPLLQAQVNVQSIANKKAATSATLTDSDLSFSWATASSVANVDWRTPIIGKSEYKPRLQISPHLNSMLGTEWGVFDYTLSLASNVMLGLWQGAALDVRHLLHITDSDDVGFSNNPLKPTETGIDRAMVHQTFRVNNNLSTQLSAGLLNKSFVGGTHQSAWRSDSGQHKLSLNLGYYKDKDDETTHKVATTGYRYFLPSFNHGIELQASRLNDQNSYGVNFVNWYGNIAVDLIFDRQEKGETYAGMVFRLPLGPRKSMNTREFQVTGIPEWRYGYKTIVSGKTNLITGNTSLSSFRLQHGMEKAYYDRDRLSPGYFNSKLPVMSRMILR